MVDFLLQVFYLTIIGAPIGRACLEFAKLSAAPFGKTIITESELKGSQNVSGAKKVISTILNILWIPIGLIATILYLVSGLLSCITIVGIPTGVVYIRMGKFLLKPIGVRVVRKDLAKMAKRVNG
jgi:uncharacterized membrane protein YccF (DUF307 family)